MSPVKYTRIYGKWEPDIRTATGRISFQHELVPPNQNLRQNGSEATPLRTEHASMGCGLELGMTNQNSQEEIAC